jgi:predicted Holliday junction resolvase-like endonuclease
MIEVSWQAFLVTIAVAVVTATVVYWVGFVKGGRRATLRHEASTSDHLQRSRQTLGGRFAEQLAPYFDEFNYDPTEARFLGSPIDFVVFPGIATGEPRGIVFVEVKSGKAQLDSGQRKLRDIVERIGSKDIRFETIRLLKDGVV